MIHYWLSALELAGQNTFLFLGKSKGGLVFDVLIIMFTVLALYKKEGLAAMRAKLRESIIQGAAIACLAAFLVFACELFAAPPAMQRELGRANEQERSLKDAALAFTGECKGLLATQTEKASLLASQKDAQQVTINSDQSQLNAQQGVVSQCVVSLGKMNPQIREMVSVITIFLGTMNRTYKPNKYSLILSENVSEMFFITNISERRFHGSVKCAEAFIPYGGPEIETGSDIRIVPQMPPRKISDNEYEVRVDSPGAEWNPSRPFYMKVKTPPGGLHSCKFVPSE